MTTLVNSHLHFDHVGGNKLFAGVKNVVHEQELAQARNHEPFEFFGYSDKTWDHEGANFEPVSGDLELAKGLWLYETPGHTVGHYSLLVKPESRRRRPMLFAFDVVYTQPALEKGIQPGFHNDPPGGRPLDRAGEGAGRGARRGHLLLARRGGLQGYKHAPDFYEL